MQSQTFDDHCRCHFEGAVSSSTQVIQLIFQRKLDPSLYPLLTEMCSWLELVVLLVTLLMVLTFHPSSDFVVLNGIDKLSYVIL